MFHVAWRSLIGILLIVAGTVAAALPQHQAHASDHTVYVIRIDGEIELGVAAYLKRVLREADESDAAAVILEINTPGGRLDAALEMRDAILDSNVEPIAFINREAFSAGALIALATSRVYMTSGSVYGAATPVDGTGAAGDEKIISAVRSVFRSTAELRDRDPLVAEAMVDPDIVVPGLAEAGKLLTLSTTQALEWGFADARVSGLDDLLSQAGLEGATVIETSIQWSERLVRFLTNPIIASLLISLGSLMILLDLYTAGFGVLGLSGMGMLATFFWGHFLAGLAGWEGVLLVLLGLALLGVEAFVIPGFGIAGILGIVSILGGMFISLIGGEIVTDADIQRAGLTVAGAFVIILLGGALILTMLPQASRFKSLVLQSQVGVPDEVLPERARRRRRRWWRSEEPEVGPVNMTPPVAIDASVQSLVGARGVALSDLRPGGFARINGLRVDVVTQGDFVPAGTEVEIISDEGYRRVVRQAE